MPDSRPSVPPPPPVVPSGWSIPVCLFWMGLVALLYLLPRSIRLYDIFRDLFTYSGFGSRPNDVPEFIRALPYVLPAPVRDFLGTRPGMFLGSFLFFPLFAQAHYRVLARQRAPTQRRVRSSSAVMAMLGCLCSLAIWGVMPFTFLMPFLLAMAIPRITQRTQIPSPAALTCFYLLMALDGVFYGLIGLVLTIWVLLILLFGGLNFPWQGNRRRYWLPTHLPKLRGTRGGFTLIELLIDVAILAILTAGVVNLSGTLHRSMEFEQAWGEAIGVAESQIALMRAAGEPPEIGLYGLDDALAESLDHPFAAQVLVRPGPVEAVREVSVRILVEAAGHRREVAVSALLASGIPGEVRP